MKSFKDYITGRNGYRFREIINELTDAELEQWVQDYTLKKFEFLNLRFVNNRFNWNHFFDGYLVGILIAFIIAIIVSLNGC